MDNIQYPFELLAAQLRAKDRDSDELFTILFNYFPHDKKEEIISNEFKVTPYNANLVLPKYKITLYVSDSDEVITLNLVYKNNLYHEYKIKRIMRNILALTKMVIENGDIEIGAATYPDEQVGAELGAEFEAYFESNDLG